MVPVLELRGAIPYGIAAGGNAFLVALFAIAGNLLPIPFLIFYTKKVLWWMRDHFAFAHRFVDFLEKRAYDKSALVHKYGFWGICLLVAIPLPGTGAWTGALVAAMLNMRIKTAFPAIALGVVIASLIVIVPSLGLVG